MATPKRRPLVNGGMEKMPRMQVAPPPTGTGKDAKLVGRAHALLQGKGKKIGLKRITAAGPVTDKMKAALQADAQTMAGKSATAPSVSAPVNRSLPDKSAVASKAANTQRKPKFTGDKLKSTVNAGRRKVKRGRAWGRRMK